jgi:hypothetical protein
MSGSARKPAGAERSLHSLPTGWPWNARPGDEPDARAKRESSMSNETSLPFKIARAACCAAFALLACACASASASADKIEAMMSPGVLIEGHAKAESKCENCHAPFKKDRQDGLCIACHKEAGRELDRKTGFHGRIKDRHECRTCHTDHKGRDARIVIASEETFDHSQTDFALKDAHLKVKCADCHLAGRKYRVALWTCVGCHRKDDDKKGHKGSLGDKCEACHTVKNWKDAIFDHDKTRFPLKQRHADVNVKCADCHPKNRFKHTPLTCNGCHKKDDDRKGHKGKEGPRCEDCHFETDWKTTKNKFDHGLTTFPLLGKHGKVKCLKCHETQNFKEARIDCVACHRKDDDKAHKGRLGEICEDCHNAVDWKRWSYDHNARTRFKLEGKHAKVSCYGCHNQPVKGRALLAMTCMPCHRGDDAHAGSYGQDCERCHTGQTWKELRARMSRAPMPVSPGSVGEHGPVASIPELGEGFRIPHAFIPSRT